MQGAAAVGLSRHTEGVSQRGCKGRGHWGSACNRLLPGWWLHEAAAGWRPEEVAGSGSPRAGRRWTQVQLQEQAEGLQKADSCCCAVRREERQSLMTVLYVGVVLTLHLMVLSDDIIRP